MDTEETEKPHMTTYAQAGVDTAEGARAVRAIKETVHSTYRPEVVGDIGGFGGLFSIAAAKDMEQPLLVSGTDGVGTKLQLARLLGKHDSLQQAPSRCSSWIILRWANFRPRRLPMLSPVSAKVAVKRVARLLAAKWRNIPA